MKTKEGFKKKLVLKSKTTVADLNNMELHGVKGGTYPSENCNTLACTVYVSACPECDTVLCH